MVDSSPALELEARTVEQSDDALIRRVSAARRAGDNLAEEVDTLIRRAAERNKAALDHLAK